MNTTNQLLDSRQASTEVLSEAELHIDLSAQDNALRFQGDLIASGSHKDRLFRSEIPGFSGNQCEFVHLELRNSLTGQTAEVSGQLESLPTGDLLFMERDHFSGSSLLVSDNQIEIDRIRVMSDTNMHDVAGPRGTTVQEGSRRMHVSCFERAPHIEDPFALPEMLEGTPVQLTYIHEGDKDHPGNYLTVSGTVESLDDQGVVTLKAAAGREREEGRFQLNKEFHRIVKVEPATLAKAYDASEYATSASSKEGSAEIATFIKAHYGAGSNLELHTTDGFRIKGSLQEITRGHQDQAVLVLSNDEGVHAYYMDEIEKLAPVALQDIQEDRYHGAASGGAVWFSTR